jgi:hypothetical protein
MLGSVIAGKLLDIETSEAKKLLDEKNKQQGRIQTCQEMVGVVGFGLDSS